jgi:hypothetical protein
MITGVSVSSIELIFDVVLVSQDADDLILRTKCFYFSRSVILVLVLTSSPSDREPCVTGIVGLRIRWYKQEEQHFPASGLPCL